MAIDINVRYVRKIGFLNENFSEDFLISLSKQFKEVRFGPEEIIYSQGKIANAFYILKSGVVL